MMVAVQLGCRLAEPFGKPFALYFFLYVCLCDVLPAPQYVILVIMASLDLHFATDK